jgi:predicted Fe-Mo cluster-binding NifX family protein
MKIAVTSKGKDMSAEVDSRFGRCSYFVIVDVDTEDYRAVENQNAFVSGGAGVGSAQFIVEQGVKAVVTGHVGPKALKTLEAAGVEVYTGASGTIKNALEQYKSGKLKAVSEATVSQHFGLNNKKGGSF